MRGFFKEFKEFATYGNMVDMSVGMIIGAAFSKVVNTIIGDLFMPPIGFLLGKVNFSNLYINLSGHHYDTLAEAKEAGAATINYGVFFNALIEFTVIMFVVFLFIRQWNRIRRPKEKTAPVEQKECPYCLSSIPVQAVKCPYCTADLGERKKKSPKIRIG
ncbi:MAG TPA: large conductance mechanosensitive channel protein MscL [Bacillales bacterium]|nr:large conductance mechanosensitive channel protein MscL [Bacillales bacterium]